MHRHISKLLLVAGHARVAGLAAAAACATATILTATPALAAGAAATPTTLEGDWVRIDTNGSRSFGDLDASFAKAELTPKGITTRAGVGQRALRPLDDKPHKAGEAYVVVDRPCVTPPGGEGALATNPDSAAIHIVESRAQVIIAPERWGARTIYLDGRPQPDPALLTPSGGGYAIGHYESGTLVVDTVGLGTGQVPAGGVRTPRTHLHERYEVSPDGKQLTIHYTYSDPDLYLKPHSYDYVLERLPPGSYALEDWCDASDPKESTSIVPPKQD
jgi:hypothetical protein